MKKKYNGFTLLELIIVMILLAIVAAIGSRVIWGGFTGYLTSQNVTTADWQGRIALERMIRDLRSIRSPSDITTATASQIIFTDFSGNTINYQHSGNSLLRNSQILADGIQSLSLSYFDKNGNSTSVLTLIRYITITINVTLNQTNSVISTAAYPRNLL